MPQEVLASVHTQEYLQKLTTSSVRTASDRVTGLPDRDNSDLGYELAVTVEANATQQLVGGIWPMFRTWYFAAGITLPAALPMATHPPSDRCPGPVSAALDSLIAITVIWA